MSYVMSDKHKQLIKKFSYLSGTKILGKEMIKGKDKLNRVPADEIVESEHILHDLIRGFYKPKDMPFLLSYQATEISKNYGKQIHWKNQKTLDYEYIDMLPPDKITDNRRISDIKAANFNYENNIPFGVLWNVDKGANIILGLGIIKEISKEGIYKVYPYKELELTENTIETGNRKSIENTEILRVIKTRIGQSNLRKEVLDKNKTCKLCNIKSDYCIVSHIKPWAISNDDERLDTNNVLLLCPNHDKLFDSGKISFDSKGDILISNEIKPKAYLEWNINNLIAIKNIKSQEKYLNYHRNNIFTI